MDARDVSIRGDRRTDVGADPDDLLWRQLAEATSAEALARTWLALQCRMIPGVAAGVLVVRSGEQDFVPAAFWPEGRRPRPHLAQVAERALRERRSVSVPVPQPEGETGSRLRFDVAQPIETHGALHGVVAIDVACHSEHEAQLVRRHLQWGAAWLEISRMRADTSQAAVVRDRLQTVLDLVASAFGHRRFAAGALAFVTTVATRLNCDRVTLGFAPGGRARAVAMSHTARFSRQSNLVRAIEQAMDEALDQRALVLWPQPAAWRAQVARAHAELVRHHDVGTVCTVPLVEGDRVLGALTLERPADQPFDTATAELVEVLAGLAGPILERGRRDDRWIGAKVADWARDLAGRVVGPGHVGLKVALAAAAAVLIVVSTVPGDFRVASDATLEPRVRQAVTAPFPGYVAEAPVRAGDTVKPGQRLATLDDRELRLSRLKWLSQQEQLTRQFDQAMAARNAASVGILAAQIDQARSEVALLDYHLGRTRLVAPFDGIVVTGDLSQSLAAPVERGQVLFEVAPLDSYRVVLQVNERDIAYVRTGQRGTLVLTGTPGEPLPFAVERITPVSTAREGHNFFRVEAKLDRPLERLRPGMEGVGKVEIDRRLLIWIWTRQVVDWVRLQLWRWLP
jgi:multidrug efflux pump subunit AcrA (membrane-fusion protein)